MSDIHNYAKRAKSATESIVNDASLRSTDKKLILDFLEHYRALDNSEGAVFKRAWTLHKLAMLMPVSFKAAKRKHIERVVATINLSNSSPNTKSDSKKILKRFFRYVRYGNEGTDRSHPTPSEVSWISTTIKKNEQKPKDIVSERDVERMISCAESLRDKAFISAIYEGGYRIGEILSMKIGSLSFPTGGARLRIERGKSGPRDPLLVSSTRILAAYLDSHPFKDDPEAPLWIGVEGPNKHKALQYTPASSILKKAAKAAGITKRIHPHLFRHSSATRDAEHGFSESFLESKHGWVRGSKEAARYTATMDRRRVDDKTREVYGEKEETPRPEPLFRPTTCPRCNSRNTPGQQFCGVCGTPLDMMKIVKSEEEREGMKKSISTLQNQVTYISDIVISEAEEDDRLSVEDLLKLREFKDDLLRKRNEEETAELKREDATEKAEILKRTFPKRQK